MINSLVHSLKYAVSNSTERLILDLKKGNTIQQEIEKYGPNRVEAFVEDYREALKYRDQIPHRTLKDFVIALQSADRFTNEIHAISLKMLLGIGDISSENREVIDACVDKVFPQAIKSLIKPDELGIGLFDIIHLSDKYLFTQNQIDAVIATSLLQAFTLIGNKMDNLEFIKIIRNIPANNRKDVLIKILPFLQDNKIWIVTWIAEFIRRSLDANKENVIEKIRLLLKEAPEDCKEVIRKHINAIAIDCLDNVIEYATPLFEYLNKQAEDYAVQKTLIMNQIAAIPLDDRQHVIQCAQPIIQEIKYGNLIGQFLKTVAAIPKERREPLIASARPILNGDVLNVHYVLISLAQFPPDDVDDVVLKSKEFLKTYWNGLGRSRLIEAIQKFSKEERSYIIEAISDPNFMFNNSNDSNYKLVEAIYDISRGDRRHILSLIKPHQSYFHEIKHWSEIKRIAFIKILGLIPKNSRVPSIAHLVCNFLDQISNKGLDYDLREKIFEFLFWTISTIPEDTRVYAIKSSLKYIKYHKDNRLTGSLLLAFGRSKDPETKKLFKQYFSWYPLLPIILSFVPENKRNALIEKSNLQICLQNKVPFYSLLEILTFLPIESRNRTLIQNIAISFLDMNQYSQLQLFSLLPQDFEAVLAELSQFQGAQSAVQNNNFSVILSRLCINPQLRESIFKHFQYNMGDNIHPDARFHFAQFIMNNYETLGMHEEHHLVQLAISVSNICDPAALKNPTNPYSVFNMVTKSIADEGWILPDSELERWNLKKLRERGLWKGYTIDDLPKGIHPDTIRNIFGALHGYLDYLGQLDPAQQDKVLKYIEETCGTSLTVLESNLTEKPFINNLLTNPGTDKVSSSAFHLFSILHAILDASTVCDSQTGLTPQEELLLKMSASVQECATGQRDGLAYFYNALPANYRKGPIGLNTGDEAVEAFVDECIQKTLNDGFANELFLKEVMGDHEIPQASHVTLFLKNRYHKQVGFRHQIVFDAHTGVLNDRLLLAKPEKVLGCFFKHCKACNAVQQIVNDSTQALKEGHFMVIMSLIAKVEGNISDEETYQRYCTFNENLEPVQLTEKGATALLQAVGYLV